jgi:hypothetical protein
MIDAPHSYRAVAGDVYHTLALCPSGRQIPEEWRREGTGGLPLCPACRARSTAESRAPGSSTSLQESTEARVGPRDDGQS